MRLLHATVPWLLRLRAGRVPWISPGGGVKTTGRPPRGKPPPGVIARRPRPPAVKPLPVTSNVLPLAGLGAAARPRAGIADGPFSGSGLNRPPGDQNLFGPQPAWGPNRVGPNQTQLFLCAPYGQNRWPGDQISLGTNFGQILATVRPERSPARHTSTSG